MNLFHRWLCASNVWARFVGDRIVPWVLDGIELGPDVLEIGAGSGAATAPLRHRTARLTCVERDERSAARLRDRMAPHHVTVLCENAAATSLPDGSFDAVLAFSMLHHLPAAALQDVLFAEAARLLKPGGVFAGFDPCLTRGTRLMHAFDTWTPVDPAGLPARLERAGFAAVAVDVKTAGFRFRARRSPALPTPRGGGE